MKIKTFTMLLYMLAGLLIAVFTSLMTYIIIGKPIKMPMIKQIIMVVASVAPAIGVLSYFFGAYLSKKFIFIEQRLERIKQQDFQTDESRNMLVEIDEINQKMNYLATQLHALIVDLKQKNKNLAEMLVSMAHDIKTPITILGGHIEEIEDGLVEEGALPDVLVHMKEELAFMDELTVDMLQYIQSMGSKEERVQCSLNVYEILETKIFPLLPYVPEVQYINQTDRNLTLTFNCTDFKRIALNILNNAVKYTHTGHIKVYSEGATLYFENTGEAIDAEHANEIFEPFYTIDKSKNRKQSGFGLGLSIVKNLSQGNGYRCSLYRSDSEKTIFSLQPSSEETASAKVLYNESA